MKTSTKNGNRVMKRDERRLQATQIRKNKRFEAMDKKRKLGGMSGLSAPFLTCFVALHEDIDINSAFATIEASDEEMKLEKSNPQITYLK